MCRIMDKLELTSGEMKSIIDNTWTLKALSKCKWLDDFKLDLALTYLNNGLPVYMAKVNTTEDIWTRIFGYCVENELYPKTMWKDDDCFSIYLYEYNHRKLEYTLLYGLKHLILMDNTGFKYALK